MAVSKFTLSANRGSIYRYKVVKIAHCIKILALHLFLYIQRGHSITGFKKNKTFNLKILVTLVILCSPKNNLAVDKSLIV